MARQLWNGMVTARHENDRDALRALLKGPALEATLGDMCDCPGIPKFVAETFSVNVPRQTSWPAVFFASATYTSSCEASARPCVDSFVAVQDRERGPWKIALWVGYSGRLNAETSGVGPGSFALDPPPLTYRDAVTLPAEYAEYRDSLKRTGEPPPQTRLGPGPFTTGEAEWLYDPPAEQRARNLSEGTSYTVGGDPMYAFTAVAETAVVCGTVRYTSVATALPGMTIRQSQEQTEWGTKLAPGRYSSIVAEGLHMVCFELYANPNVPVTVFGRYGSVTKVTGTRAD